MYRKDLFFVWLSHKHMENMGTNSALRLLYPGDKGLGHRYPDCWPGINLLDELHNIYTVFSLTDTKHLAI